MDHLEIAYIIGRSCLRKANLTEEEANALVDHILKTEGRLIYFYKCTFCNSIHLTKSIKTPVNKIDVK